MMKTAYQILPGGLLGSVMEVDRTAPEGFTFTAPEDYSPGLVYRWTGHGWRAVADEQAADLRRAALELALASARAARLAALTASVDAERDARIGAGMPYAFPDGGGTVQLRNERDIINVTGVGTSGMMLAAAGDTDAAIGFRDQEDVTHRLTGAQAQALGQAVMAWMSAHYTAAWAHKDALGRLAEAGDFDALDAYDITAGWPGVEA